MDARNEGEKLKLSIKGKGYEIGAVADLLGMSRQNLGHHLRKEILDDDFRRKVKELLPDVLQMENEGFVKSKIKKADSDPVNETIRDLARSSVVLAEANKVMAEANNTLANNNTILISKVNSVPPQRPDVILLPYLQQLAKGVAGKSWSNESDVMREFRKILTDVLVSDKVLGK